MAMQGPGAIFIVPIYMHSLLNKFPSFVHQSKSHISFTPEPDMINHQCLVKNNVEEERQLKRVMTIYITWATLELFRAGDKETKIHSKRVQ